MQDHRNYIRLATSTLVHFDSKDSEWIACLTDISIGGFKCHAYEGTSVEALTLDSVYHCTFVLPSGKVEAQVKVVWLSSESLEIGLEFMGSDEGWREPVTTYCNSPW